MPHATPHAAALAEIAAIVGPRGLLTGPEDTAAYVEDWRRL